MQVRLSPRRRLGTYRLGETVAHNTPVGFWSMAQLELNDLSADLVSMWNGETSGTSYRAADRVIPFLHAGTWWGHNRDDPIGSTFWPGHPEPTPTNDDWFDAWRNSRLLGRAVGPRCRRRWQECSAARRYTAYRNLLWCVSGLGRYASRRRICGF